MKRGTSRKRHKLGYCRIVVVMLVNIFMLSLCWPFSYSLMQFPPSILKISTQHPPYFFKLSTQHQPAITRIENWAIIPTRTCSSATHLFVRFKKYLRTQKQHSSIQQRTLAWTNSSSRARRHVWCWVEFHPHHCLRGERANDHAIAHLRAKTVLYNLRFSKSVQRLWSCSVHIVPTDGRRDWRKDRRKKG